MSKRRRWLSEVIVTSPIGVVPRELERVFPAANYDLPVTGDWDAEEVEIAAEALATHLSKFDESCVVVAHVSGGYEEIVRHAEPDTRQEVIYTCTGQAHTAKASLDSLTEALRGLCASLSLTRAPSTEVVDTLRAVADFQFGPPAGDVLVPDGCRLTGRLDRMVVVRTDRGQLCAFVAPQGHLSLTLAGGEQLATLDRYWVAFEGHEIRGGSLFAVGVTGADAAVRPGDEVVVRSDDGRVVAVGRSKMSGPEMCALESGVAVDIRHKVR